MYRQLEDFISDWKYESSSTLKLFKNIPDKVLNKKDHENVRSIAVLCWHITLTIGEMLNRTGLTIDGPAEHSVAPTSMSEIIAAYEKSSNSLITNLQQNWNDQALLNEVNMYGENWPNGRTLFVLITHQTHHRGQLTVLMRQAGLMVPGIYGPSKEEWAAMNLPAME